MIACYNCHAWRPKNFSPTEYKWLDKEAGCIYKGGPFAADHTCADGSVVSKFSGKSRAEELRDEAIAAITPGRVPEVITHEQSIEPTAVVQQPVKRPHHTDSSPRISDSFDDYEPTDLRLYEHQQVAVERFADKQEIALFMSMGTGKSATVLAIAKRKWAAGEIDALLIVAPNEVHTQWYREQVPKWLDVPYDMQCLFGRGGQKEAWPFENRSDFMQIVCVNIDTFSTPKKWRDIVDWANSHKTFIILDEATCIKNVNAQRTQRLLYEFNDTVRKGKTILSSVRKSVARAILTGTPVTNGAMDLWSLFEFLRPNFFGRNWYAFQNYYGMFTKIAVEDKDGNARQINVPLSEDWWKSIKSMNSYEEAAAICGCTVDTYNTVHSQTHYEGPYKHADELKKLIAPYSIFKRLEECVDMPAQNYYTRTVSMSKEQQECYDTMAEEYIATYDTHTVTALNKLTVIIRLQQISSGFLCDKQIINAKETDPLQLMYDIEEADILPDEIKWIGTTNPKLEALYNDVQECDRPLIIATRFTAEAARIYGDLQSKYKCCLMTGWKRVGTIEDFKDGKYDIMVANTAVINKGFNLQNSHSTLIYSNTFSLEQRLQLEGRTFRLGQGHPCGYWDYQNKGTVDEKIVSVLQLKRNLLDYIMNTTPEELVA